MSESNPSGRKITLKNDHGELIHVKSYMGKIYVHHEDCSVDYVVWEQFINTYILSPDEIVMIRKAVFDLIHGN